MKRMMNNYTKEFKTEAIQLVLKTDRPIVQIAKELGIRPGTLYAWMNNHKKHGQEAFPGKGLLMPEDEKTRRLEKELRQVTMERDILKKAMAVFSRDQK